MLRAGAWALAGALLLGGLAGCERGDDGDAPKREVVPPPPPPPTAAAATPTAEGDDPRTKLLAWLDPDAISLAYLRMPTPLRAEAVAVVYGLPPRAEDLLSAVTDVDAALEAVRPLDAPSADAWLGPQALVTAGRLSKRPLVLRPLTVPRAEAIARLEALGLSREEVDAFEVWVPRRVLPYRVVLLGDDVVGFIPATEPGTGLPPLIAARDMPPSEAETQLDALLSAPGGPQVALLAAGPMLHLDLDQDVLQVRFELRRSGDGSLDGQVALMLEEGAEAAAKALEDRKAPEQNDGVQRLMDQAAFMVDGPIVAGRLQVTPTDATLLLEDGK